jgi:hypothetical protein
MVILIETRSKASSDRFYMTAEASGFSLKIKGIP